MTIKRYLFLLIGGVIVCTAIIQLLLISVFKQHLDQEVLERSKTLSTQMVNFAIEQIELEDEDQVFIHKSSNVDDNCTIKRSFSQKDDTTNQTIKNKIELECISDDNQLNQQKRVIKQQLHRIIKQKQQLEANVDTDVQVHTISTSSTPQFEFITDIKKPKVFSLKTEQPSATDQLINYMIYLIIASSGLALIIALWLSHHFTKPLQQLSFGFKQLKQGQFGVQLNEQGIKEYRTTLNAFNQMSGQLAAFAEKEKLLQQQSHLAELGEVSRGLAHALRNPMHTIGLSVEQLKDAELPETLRAKLVKKITNKIKHIDKTIKALLRLTTAEINRNDPVLIRSVIQDIILEVKSHNQETTIELPDSTEFKNLTLYGSESEIRAILHTIIINAVEANKDKGTVTISFNHKNEDLQLQVKDQGDGIAKAVQDKLFQPHVSSKAEGAGMGLYIARRLATLYYAGDLQLNNHPDGGCIATVTLNKEINHASLSN